MNPKDKYAGAEWLEGQGFNLLQVLDTARLPEELLQSLTELGVEVKKKREAGAVGDGGARLVESSQEQPRKQS